MKKINRRTFHHIIALILGLVGIYLLWGKGILLGIFFLLWANNIGQGLDMEKQINEWRNKK